MTGSSFKGHSMFMRPNETNRPDDRRAAGSWVLPSSETRRQGNHEAAKSGIKKKIKTSPRSPCKIEYLLTSNHSDRSIASEFFTGDIAAGGLSCQFGRISRDPGDQRGRQGRQIRLVGISAPSGRPWPQSSAAGHFRCSGYI